MPYLPQLIGLLRSRWYDLSTNLLKFLVRILMFSFKVVDFLLISRVSTRFSSLSSRDFARFRSGIARRVYRALRTSPASVEEFAHASCSLRGGLFGFCSVKCPVSSFPLTAVIVRPVLSFDRVSKGDTLYNST